MSTGEGSDRETEKTKNQKTSHAERWAFIRRTPTFLNWFESPKILKRIKPYIKEGQVISDIGCGWGYYSFILANLVGSKGKVYSVDLSEKCIRSIQKKAIKHGDLNIEAHASTAADLGFINEKSVDMVFANGLLCSMENDRMLAVKEIKRILKPQGHAYISLGSPPPFGLVNQVEWNEILSMFIVEEGGIYKELWVIVTK
jgi:ubiquinone/menaquinone biosynthesis C-methylase UbiE